MVSWLPDPFDFDLECVGMMEDVDDDDDEMDAGCDGLVGR